MRKRQQNKNINYVSKRKKRGSASIFSLKRNDLVFRDKIYSTDSDESGTQEQSSTTVEFKCQSGRFQ